MTVLEPQEAYRLLAADYDTTPNALIALEERIMAPLLPDLKGRTVVDVGSGTGRWAKYAAGCGASAMGVDLCYEMLRAGHRPAVLADARYLPFPEACADVVICALTLGYAPGCFLELRRVVCPGGTVFVSDIHPDALQRGWKRTFRHDGEVIEIAHQTYSLEDLHAPGLELMRLMEPHLGFPEKTIFDLAGCPERFEEAARWPALFVAQFVRTAA
jgi:ubiquinone/menaquinone biosynthesis C-methylase UbiE